MNRAKGNTDAATEIHGYRKNYEIWILTDSQSSARQRNRHVPVPSRQELDGKQPFLTGVRPAQKDHIYWAISAKVLKIIILYFLMSASLGSGSLHSTAFETYTPVISLVKLKLNRPYSSYLAYKQVNIQCTSRSIISRQALKILTNWIFRQYCP